MIHEVTVKRSLKRFEMWQMKGEGHELYPLSEMHLVLFKMIKHLGGDLEDRNALYLLRFSEEPFDGYLIGLKKVEHRSDSYGTGCEYVITETQEVEYFMSDPVFPSAMKLLIKTWPEKIYLSLSRTNRRIMLPAR